MCTWGAAGYAEVWLNASNDWIYPHLDMAAERMVELARRYDITSELEWRALNQAARELVLAQSSDWAFIMKTNTTVEYAKKRTRDHVARFDYLYRALTGQCTLEEPILREFEDRDNVFPEIDYACTGSAAAGTGRLRGPPPARAAAAGSWYRETATPSPRRRWSRRGGVAAAAGW
jgi:1,4-alpha-glucan branching enzyme